MIKVAFIDDEKNILDGIRRMLRGYRSEWDMYFYISANDALDAMEENQFDVIVSDMRMPKMNGAEFLNKVKELSPKTIRIALSGFSETEMTLESVHATHQFIAKPADPEVISSSLIRALEMSSELNNPDLQALLGSIQNLPVLPKIYDELMQEIASEESAIQNVAKIVSSDLALSTELMRIVNSAYFGLVRHVENVEQAVSILGMETIKNLALMTCVFKSFPDDASILPKIEVVNNQSQKLGALVQKITKRSSLSARAKDHAQIAAMMSKLGELLEICYPSNIDESYELPLIAGYLLSIWNMPYPIIEAVRWHRKPQDSGIKELSPLTIVHLAWAMQTSLIETGQLKEDHPAFQIDYLKSVMDETAYNEYIDIGIDFFNTTED